MKSTSVRFQIVILLVLFFCSDMLRNLATDEVSSPATVSAGGIAVFDRPPMMIFTCSEDGKTLYRWQCDPKAPSKEPKYLGKTEAVLSE